MLVEGTTEYPEINDLDLLIDCKESITKSKLKELDKEINEKFKSVMFSSFEIEGIDAEKFEDVKSKIIVSIIDPQRLLIRGAINRGKRKIKAFFDLEYRENNYNTYDLTELFKIQSRDDLLQDKIMALSKTDTTFSDKLIPFFKSGNTQHKIQTLLPVLYNITEKTGAFDIRRTEYELILNDIMIGVNLTPREINLLGGYLNTLKSTSLSSFGSNKDLLTLFKEWEYFDEFEKKTDTPLHKLTSWVPQKEMLDNSYKPVSRKLTSDELDKIYAIIMLIHVLENLDPKFKNLKFLIKGGFATHIHTRSPEIFSGLRYVINEPVRPARSEPEPETPQQGRSEPEPETPQPDRSDSEPETPEPNSAPKQSVSSKKKNKKKYSAQATQIDDESWYVEPTYYDKKWKQIKEFWEKNKMILIAAGIGSIIGLYKYYYPTEAPIDDNEVIELNEDGTFKYYGALPEDWIDVTGNKRRSKRLKKTKRKKNSKKKRKTKRKRRSKKTRKH